MLLVDRTGRILRLNRDLCRLLGSAVDEPAGRTVSGLLPLDLIDEAMSQVLAFEVPQPPLTAEGSLVDRAGNRRAIRWSIGVLPGSDPGRLLAVLTGVDVTQERRELLALRLRADRDALTQMMNKAAFEERLTEALDPRVGRDCTLLYADLDGFKEINDAHGHSVGDQVLAEIGRRISRSIRRTDVCGRVGGDEFAILIFGRNLDGARRLSTRMEAAIAEPLVVPGVDLPLQVGVSIGIRAAGPGEPAAQVLADADAAMYRCKRDPSQGRHRH